MIDVNTLRLRPNQQGLGTIEIRTGYRETWIRGRFDSDITVIDRSQNKNVINIPSTNGPVIQHMNESGFLTLEFENCIIVLPGLTHKIQ